MTGDRPEVLTVPEVAAMLRLGRRACYEAIQRGDIPGVLRIGERSIRVSRAVLMNWIDAGADGKGEPQPDGRAPGFEEDTGWTTPFDS